MTEFVKNLVVAFVMFTCLAFWMLVVKLQPVLQELSR